LADAMVKLTGHESLSGETVAAGAALPSRNSWSMARLFSAICPTIGMYANFPASFGLENTQHINQFKAGLNWHIAPNIW
jgi:hypothetical protein